MMLLCLINYNDNIVSLKQELLQFIMEHIEVKDVEPLLEVFAALMQQFFFSASIP